MRKNKKGGKETFLGAHTSYVSNWVRSGQVRKVLFNLVRAFRWADVMVRCCVAWSRGPMPNQVACCVVGLWGCGVVVCVCVFLAA